MKPYAKLFLVAVSGLTMSALIVLLALFFRGTKVEFIMGASSIGLLIASTILLLIYAVLSDRHFKEVSP